VKLVRQASLAFQGGTSDKVYEVDLCDVGDGKFVVNFRYGRRGSALRDGTKTTTPLARAAAESVFEKLVASKKAEGYWDQSSPPATAPAPARAPASAGSPREQAILRALDTARDRKLSRAIWRAGELALRAAEPRLLALAETSGAELRDYSLVYALGRCSGAVALPAIARLGARSELVHRMALEAARLIAFADEATRATYLDARIRELPPQLQVARDGPAAVFAARLDDHLLGALPEAYGVLETLYRIDDENVRPKLLALLATAPLAPPWFQRLRHIYKAAEARNDGRVFGLLARRFEKESHNFTFVYGRNAERLKGPGATLAFGRKTRLYLRRRTWRTLRRLGIAGDPTYARMAAGVLLAFSDADAEAPRTRGRRTFGAYSRYWAFNHILYEHSPRYGQRGRFFYSQGPEAAEPATREEAFPRIWERSPEALLHLLDESACEPVHRFAVKVLRACPDLTAKLDVDALVMLLGARYEITALLGLELVEKRFALEEIPDEIVRALADSILLAARMEAWKRLEARRSVYLERSALVAAIIASPRADTREFARRFLRLSSIPDETARVLVGRLIAHLQGMSDADDPLTDEIATDVVRTLSDCFASQLRVVGMSVVRDLLGHELRPLVVLGAEILLARQAAGEPIDGALIEWLIRSEHEPVRSLGVRLLGNLPESFLVANESLVIALATHSLADLREAIRPAARKIVEAQPAFALRLARALVDALLLRKQPEGMHSHLLRILEEDLRAVFPTLPKDVVLALLHSRVPQAQELGGILLPTNLSPEDLSVKEIVRLASHEIRSVREASWVLFERSLPRVRQALPTAVAFLDAKWADSRAFAFKLFREAFTKEELTPSVLVAICDSVLPDVQALGRELITARFEDAHGQEYLLKLSEHPSADLQLFASNYLERFAANDPAKIAALAPYFVSVLSRVNKGRVAKDRSLAFLEAEALKSADAARIVATILTRQSVTCAIGDKATAIDAMLAIKRAHPGVDLPIKVKETAVRRGV
jgi:predicted DNA-binding WGR domain protein